MKIKIISIQILSVAILFILLNTGCEKKSDVKTSEPTYSSLQDFYNKNGVPSQFFKINGSTGGTFTTPQGTKVTIGPNSFVDLNNNPVSGTVTIEFKDIYKKSDMLTSAMPTMLGNGSPLVSGGEFFIKAAQINTPDTIALNLANKKSMVVQQPSDGKDSTMQPYVIDSVTNVWVPTHTDTLNDIAGSFIFTLYPKGSNHLGRGTWCNSDDPDYFSAYTQTVLTINPGFNTSDYTYGEIDVYLVFKGINSMIHVYPNSNQYPYSYAPQGLQCTIVAVGVKNNNLWASFTPITISANQTVTIPISQITTSSFVSALKALDN